MAALFHSSSERNAVRGIRLVSAAVVVAGYFIVLLSRFVLPVEAASSLLVLWGGVAGRLLGIRWGLGISMLMAACEAWVFPIAIPVKMIGFAIRWSVVCCLLVWGARLHQRLQTEYRRARFDSLTGLGNRQSFFEAYESERSRANRFRRPLTVMLLDGDNFKSINDQRGHAQGDLALQQTASTLESKIRPYDLACRMGGDEFALLFPETTAEDAARIAARLQMSLQQELVGRFEQLTYSFGVVTLLPSVDHDADRCLAEADRMLYAAKHAGNNSIRCFVIASEPH